MRRLRFFILLFAASSLLFQLPSGAFAATPSDITATDTLDMGGNAYGVDTFTIGSSTYAIVSIYETDTVRIIDISDPTAIVTVDTETDGANGFTTLDGPQGVETFTIGSSTYAIVAATADDSGLQIIDISDPTNIVAVDAVNDDSIDESSEFTGLGGATEIDTFTIGSSTYAIVTAATASEIQIVDISDPTDISATDAEHNNKNSFQLSGVYGVDTFVLGSSTYAIVTNWMGNNVQIIDISDPSDIVAKGTATNGVNGFTELYNPYGVDTFTIGSSTYAIVVSNIGGDGIQIIDISDVDNLVAVDAETDGVNGFTMLFGGENVKVFTIDSSTYAIVTAVYDDGVQIIDISDPTDIVAVDAETDGTNGFTMLDYARGLDTFTIGSSTYAIVASMSDAGIQIIELNTGTTSSTADEGSSTCTRLVILGNCGTIAINNDEYRIIHPWSTIPTTEVMVGEPVSITLSTPHNYAAGKINSVSVYTEIFGSPTNYELGSHIDYSVTKSDYYVSESELFQVAEATHRIVQDPDVKNLEMFEVVFTMVFAKPMDTSHVVVETKNIHGIPETIYLGNALKVIERPIELLTFEEKSKFEIISEPELKVSLRPDIDIEPDMDMLSMDPEPVVSKVTCGNGTMLKDNLCMPNKMSVYFFFNQFMRLFG